MPLTPPEATSNQPFDTHPSVPQFSWSRYEIAIQRVVLVWLAKLRNPWAGLSAAARLCASPGARLTTKIISTVRVARRTARRGTGLARAKVSFMRRSSHVRHQTGDAADRGLGH